MSSRNTAMRSCLSRSVGLWLISMVVGVGLASASGSDLRLITAASQQDTGVVRALLREGVDVDETRADGVTALLWAAHWDDLEMADLLLAAGADVDASEDHGVTALARASENASLVMVDRLLAAGADADAAQASGLTPLMIAARTGSMPIIEALVAAGADVNTATLKTQSTALMWGVSEGHTDAVRALLQRDANPRTSTAAGFTPLMFAARGGDIQIGEMLLAAGVDVNELSADGTHVLPYAIVSNQDDFAFFLLDQGADPNGAMGGVPALHAAAGTVGTWLEDWYRRHGRGDRYTLRRGGRGLSADRRLPLVKALLAHGADPNGRITQWAMFMSYIGYPKKGAFEPFACGTGDLQGATPLWVAAYAANGRRISIEQRREYLGESSGAILQALLEAGAEQYLTTVDGTTPFMVAAGLGQSTFTPREPRGVRSPSAEDAVRILFEAGADINAVNEADFTALHGASMRGLNEVVEYLVEHGADIDARDFRGRTSYRMAEGSKQSFQFQAWPETAALLERLGANTRLGIPGTVQERLRDVPALATNQN